MPADTPQRIVTTASGRVVAPLYTAESLAGMDLADALGAPGQFPFTRGVEIASRDRPWVMRVSAGSGTPAQINARVGRLVAAGATGVDLIGAGPTQAGQDPDQGDVADPPGRGGASVATLADMETLLADVGLHGLSLTVGTGATAAILAAMYRVAAERRGLAGPAIALAIQHDVLTDRLLGRPLAFPPSAAMRLTIDTVAWGLRDLSAARALVVDGAGLRAYGATAGQELGFAVSAGIEYVRRCVAAGLAVDQVLPRLAFLFGAHRDVFEELAKFRAARRLWARLARDRFGATSAASWQMHLHAQTVVAGTADRDVDVARAAVQAVSAVLGGVESLRVAVDAGGSSWTAQETEDREILALRTQQVLACETGMAERADPFGGAYFVEALTSDVEAEALACIQAIDAMGGMDAAITRGFPQAELAAARERMRDDDSPPASAETGARATTVPVEPPSRAGGEEARARLDDVRRQRDASQVAHALADLHTAAAGTDNVMAAALDAVRAQATIGEMGAALRRAWGSGGEQR